MVWFPRGHSVRHLLRTRTYRYIQRTSDVEAKQNQTKLNKARVALLLGSSGSITSTSTTVFRKGEARRGSRGVAGARTRLYFFLRQSNASEAKRCIVPYVAAGGVRGKQTHANRYVSTKQTGPDSPDPTRSDPNRTEPNTINTNATENRVLKSPWRALPSQKPRCWQSFAPENPNLVVAPCAAALASSRTRRK